MLLKSKMPRIRLRESDALSAEHKAACSNHAGRANLDRTRTFLEDDSEVEDSLFVQELEGVVLGNVEESRIGHAAPPLEVPGQVPLRDHRLGSSAS